MHIKKSKNMYQRREWSNLQPSDLCHTWIEHCSMAFTLWCDEAKWVDSQILF